MCCKNLRHPICLFFFFFQAEDGIRDIGVTGVQTCALPILINQSLYPKLGFDPNAFAPVIVMAQVPNALFVNPDKVKASSVAELVAYLRDNPDKLVCATQGIGTTSHLTSEMFKLVGNVKLRDIPYRGSA